MIGREFLLCEGGKTGAADHMTVELPGIVPGIQGGIAEGTEGYRLVLLRRKIGIRI